MVNKKYKRLCNREIDITIVNNLCMHFVIIGSDYKKSMYDVLLKHISVVEKNIYVYGVRR